MTLPAAVVVGNGVSGYACARALATAGAQVTLVGPGPVVDRPPLSKHALTDGNPRTLATLEQLQAQHIDHVDATVSAVDLTARTARVVLDGGEQEVGGQNLVLAFGLSYERVPVPGLESAYVNATPAGLVAVVRRLEAQPQARVIVLGAGLVGCETAATVAGRGHAVTLIDVADAPVARLHAPMSRIYLDALGAAGVEFIGGVRIDAVQDDGGLSHVLTSSHPTLDAEVIIAATGGRPVPLAGVDTVPLQVDEGMAVAGHPGVYAVGDIAQPLHPWFGRIRAPHWDNAMHTGQIAAGRILGSAPVLDQVPFWWSDVGPVAIAEYGIADGVSEWEAQGAVQVGRDSTGRVVCTFVVNEGRQRRAARELVRSSVASF